MLPQNQTRRTRAFTALIVLTCTLATGSAMAVQPLGKAPSTIVRFADLKLAKATDVAILYRRIGWAARWICRDDGHSIDASRARNVALCVDVAIAQAVKDVNRPALTALHRNKTARVAVR